ncbi:PAS domain-containing protein [Haliangium sp.]|uniref:sensor histidine kinase n=1 Tax=Haliangium sp. TaxID=2663208 RepID=UPI003D12052F
MKEPAIPADEGERISTLRDLALLDTAPEPELDQVVRLAASIAEAPIALVSLVDADRQWFKAKCGLETAETPRAFSFCGHAILHDGPFIVPDALQDERFRDNPLVVDEPRIRFYAGFPLHAGSQKIGTLCIIDHTPRELSDRQVRLLTVLAHQIEMQFEWHRRSLTTLEGTPGEGHGWRKDQRADERVDFRIRLHPSVGVEHLGGAFERLTGFSAEEYCRDPELGNELVHPDDRSLLLLSLESPSIFRRPLKLRWRIRDGGWLWFEHHFEVVMEEGRPVAVRGKAWPLWDQSESPEQPRADLGLAAQALDVVTILGHEGTVRYQSPSVTEVFGYEQSELVGRSLFEQVHPEDSSALRTAVTSLLSGPGATIRHRYRYRHEDGSWRVVESIGRNLVDDPSVRGLLMQSRDMSSWAQVERDLENSRREAEQLADSRRLLVDDLRRLQDTKEQLTSLIVHDLKSPLTVIMVNAQYVIDEAEEAGVAVGPTRDIVRAAEAMQRMVMDLLDISRSESGRLVARLERVDLVELVHHACELMAGVLKSQQQSITQDVDGIREREIAVDPELISRVLQNLLENGAKYSPPETALSVRVADAGERVRVEVSDEGPGVPDDFKERIFQLYARVDRDVSKHVRTSRGLGLAFCKLAVEAHGGRVWVEDGAGGGSRFCVELPRDPGHPPAPSE